IQNKPISPTPPTIGQVLQYNGSQWTPVNGSAIITAGTGLYYSNNTLNSVWSTNGNYIYNNNLRINRPSWGESVLIESNIDQNDSLGYKHAHMGEYTDYKNYNRWDYISTKCESCYNDIYENQNLFIGIKSNYNNQTSYLNLFLATNISFEITNIKQNLFTRAQRGCNNINGEYNVFLIYDNNNNTNINCNIFTCKESSYKNKSSSNNIHGGIRVEYFGTTELFCTILNCNIEYHLYIEKCNTFYCCNTVWHYNAGNQNTFVEIYCGRSETIVTHSNPNTVYNNTCWKFSVSYYFEQENFNTIIGNDAGYTLKNGTHNVFICYRAGFYNTDSNKINSETYASSNQLIPCEFANDKIAFDRHDDIYFFTVGNNSSNGNRALLTSDAIWTNSFNKTLKNKFEVVSNKKLLDKTLELDIKGWYFKCIQERHVNFIDKYFYNLFYIDIFAELHYLGKSLDASDIARLSLSAIKGLKTIKYTKRSNRKLTKQNKRVKRKKIINKSSQLVKIKIK
ncbi:MAG: hypothetical protein N3A01_09570, partial [Bacteroidales bacterium]|nr:hypothetical protein [Bacteroidales bacterium]